MNIQYATATYTITRFGQSPIQHTDSIMGAIAVAKRMAGCYTVKIELDGKLLYRVDKNGIVE